MRAKRRLLNFAGMKSSNITFTHHRQHARVAGILFLLTIALYATGDHFVKTAFKNPEQAINLVFNYRELVLGALLLFANAVCVVIIGITLFPIISSRYPGVAFGYLSTRILEAIIIIIGIIGFLAAFSVCEFREAAQTDLSMYKLATRTQFWAYQLSMLVLGVGSALTCYVLYKSRLLPAALCLWGIAGYLLLVTGCLLECFQIPLGLLFSIPGGLFEVTLGVWLMVKGIDIEKT